MTIEVTLQFHEPEKAFETGDLLFVAAAAAEGLYGRARIILEAKFEYNRSTNMAVIYVGNEVGTAIARIFVALLEKEGTQFSVLGEWTGRPIPPQKR